MKYLCLLTLLNNLTLRNVAYGLIHDARADYFEVPNKYKVYEKRPGKDVSDAWEITDKLIAKLKRETAVVGSELVLFYVPIRASVYPDEWELMKTKYRMYEENWDIRLVRNNIRDICKRNDIMFIDPLNNFTQEANKLENESKRLYFVKDGHWTVHGHDLAGKVLGRYINDLQRMDRNQENIFFALNKSISN